MMAHPHLSVLSAEIIHYFAISCRAFLDGTVGAGGHAHAILQSHPEIKRLVGLDQDPLALSIATERLAPWYEKVSLVQANFENLKEVANSLRIEKVDAILLDLGVSSMQLD